MKSNEPAKTNEAMKKTMRFLSTVALALVGAVMAGCSSDDSLQQPEKKSNVVTLTTTVGFDTSVGTRALDAAGKRIFAVGDQIAVMYRKSGSSELTRVVSNELTTGDITNDGKSATLTFTLDDPDKTANPLYFYYPASMVTDAGEVNYAALSTQDGTLATLGPTLDACRSTAAWNGDNLPSVNFNENLIAVLALTLKNSDGSSTITSGLTTVTVSDGTNTYTVSASSTTFGSDVIYVAVKPVSTATSLTVTAADGTKNYTKTTTARTYSEGKFYTMSLRMAEAASAPAGAKAVDLGLSVKWANMNVGAEKETDYGDFFAWGETTGYSSVYFATMTDHDFSWANYKWSAGSKDGSKFSKYVPSTQSGYWGGAGTPDNILKLESADDAAAVNWGGSWRMPTYTELKELRDTKSNTTDYTWTWTTVDGHKGWKITSKKSGTTGNSIFLPVAGYRQGTRLYRQGQNGLYWSSTLKEDSPNYAWYLGLDSGDDGMSNDIRRYGLSVRPVQSN